MMQYLRYLFDQLKVPLANIRLHLDANRLGWMLSIERRMYGAEAPVSNPLGEHEAMLKTIVSRHYGKMRVHSLD